MKQIASLLAGTYLLLSGFMGIGMEQHVLMHGRSTHHAAQHTTFICTWMCAASTFVHTPDQKLNGRFISSIAILINISTQIFHSISFSPDTIRPPPFFLS